MGGAYIYIYHPLKLLHNFFYLFLVEQQRYSIRIRPSFISHLEEKNEFCLERKNTLSLIK